MDINVTPDGKAVSRISGKEIAIVVLTSLALGLVIYGANLFNLSVPIEGDVRAHIFKIDVLHQALSQGYWPQWSTYLYNGFPLFQYYPPGFYLLGALLTFVTGSAVVAYKLLLLLILMGNGLAAYYFARRFLGIRLLLALTCLIAYQTSTPLLLNFIHGAAPNLLAWSVAVVFLAFYLRHIVSGRGNSLPSIAVPGLLLGLSLLIHPFPAIFSTLAAVVCHLVYLAYRRYRWQAVKSQAVYFAGVFGLGALLSAHFWLSAVLTRSYVSPIHLTTAEAWPGGVPYLAILAALALVIGLAVRLRVVKDIRFDILCACILLAAALGFGASRFIPFGLSSLVHEFRFATMSLPLFSILLIVLSIEALPAEIKQRRLSLVLMATCLVLTTSVLPLNYAYKSINFHYLFTYTRNYLESEYAQLLEEIDSSRLVVTIDQGYLVEGDSAVVFGWRYGVECINGAYNQGDPSFFDYTVHLEWEERWLDYSSTRDNLMQAGDAGYIFIRSPRQMPFDTQGLKLLVDNDYGQLWQLEQDSHRVVNVTPVLLDVADATAVTEFFNILLPGGYRMVLVDRQDVGDKLAAEFDYVMLDDESKASDYAGKTVLLLASTAEGVQPVVEEGNIIRFSLPYQSYTERLLYHDDLGDIGAWRELDKSDAVILDEATQATLQQAGDELAEYLARLEYEPVEYQYDTNSIELSAEPGFILVKDSYFPYWQTQQGDIAATSQGFILVYTRDADTLLEYRKPAINTVASVVTMLGLTTLIGFLIGVAIRRKRRQV